MELKKLVIGLTGRAGSGKSVAAKLLKSKLKAQLIDCDKVGHTLLKNGAILAKLKIQFGAQIIDENNNVDRKILGKLVFSDKAKLLQLNNVMHPAINHYVNTTLKQYDGVTIIDGALLEDLQLLNSCHVVIVMDATDDLIKKQSP